MNKEQRQQQRQQHEVEGKLVNYDLEAPGFCRVCYPSLYIRP